MGRVLIKSWDKSRPPAGLHDRLHDENSFAKSRVSTKSQLGVKQAQSANGVKQSMSRNLNEMLKTRVIAGLLFNDLVPKGGLEPPRVTSHAPQTCASASSATSALFVNNRES